MQYLKCFIFALSFSISLNSLASEKTPWVFNAPKAEGYSIKLTASDPLPGTPLVAGEEVQIKVSGSYSMSIAKSGFIVLVPQDEKNNQVGSGETQISQAVNSPKGTFELSQTIKVPKGAKEIRLFVPLVPKGLTDTTGEITILYPVVKNKN
jgi:hypothetical protein